MGSSPGGGVSDPLWFQYFGSSISWHFWLVVSSGPGRKQVDRLGYARDAAWLDCLAGDSLAGRQLGCWTDAAWLLDCLTTSLCTCTHYKHTILETCMGTDDPYVKKHVWRTSWRDGHQEAVCGGFGPRFDLVSDLVFFQGIMIKNVPTFCKKGQVPIKPLSLLLCQQGTTSRSFTWMCLTSCCDKLLLFVRLRQQVVQPCCHSTHTLLIAGHELWVCDSWENKLYRRHWKVLLL